ncbi:cbb3-type cytochrome c oxidase subunit I [Bacillus sp. ISL-7]|uniref:cbb3-type cytochrome c oxidase subunit I n=1 Tax=Bacillus sp. ISL-7 TaxID=2819136 RepID=UPI001BE841BC|nr:cbb3-type cytochrome c oxidase subunit I [Bacillus sp. ISL-7]MBT2733359.1 cbb3-type cytochrome c oxidase subunit I [Bacillus sp. ISL-7]
MEIQRGTPTKKVVKTNKNAMLKSILVITILLSFTVLLVGGYWIFKEQAPRPVEVTNEKGDVLFTKDTIMGGQAVFQRYGLMDYGTVLGHGSYMGPDYTAEALKLYTEGMQDFKANAEFGKNYASLNEDQKSVIKNKVIKEMRKNRYDSNSDTMKLTNAQAYGLEKVREYYKKIFTKVDGWGLTPAHGHGSMMGVYGMFACAVLLYSLRNIVKPEAWNHKWIKFSCIMLNVGLAVMVFLSLLPVGFIQIKEAFNHGYDASRSASFLQKDIVETLRKWRAVPDTIFLIGVVVLLLFCTKAIFNLRKPTHKEGEKLPVKDLSIDED